MEIPLNSNIVGISMVDGEYYEGTIIDEGDDYLEIEATFGAEFKYEEELRDGRKIITNNSIIVIKRNISSIMEYKIKKEK